MKAGIYIQEAYYIEFDHFGQLRIVGPNNHLHFGAVGLSRDEIEIQSVEPGPDNGAIISGYFKAQALFFHDPAMGHIRKVRDLIKPANHPGQITLDEVVRRHPGELAPSFIGYEETTDGPALTYRRTYGDRWYGFRLELQKGTKLHRSINRRGFDLESPGPRISFRLIPQSHPTPHPGIGQIFSKLDEPRKPALKEIWESTDREIQHMLRYRKTSGFDYGTVFPRDWMESADLGEGDLLPSARHYMYLESLKHVDYRGRGWHENIVGEYNYLQKREIVKVEDSLEQLVREAESAKERLKTLVRQAKSNYINRNMVDIEPHYLIGFNSMMDKVDSPTLDNLRSVAKYVKQEADSQQLITFKKIPGILKRHKDESYFSAGNWRDGDGAYKRIHPVIAPYDVNVVF
ncbi:MAG TPA: hypothetical protein VLF41_03605, partial [Candidatus Nanoarchaeia archaeon]|nr:hypothetical protein [Candidatus Nanoarchaeia archaeon]